MTIAKKRPWVLMAAGAFLALPLLAQRQDSAQVSALLHRASADATQLATEAETLTSYSRSKVSWESHSQQLSTIKDQTNQLGKTLAELQDAKAKALPWQQQAIDQITPLAQELAADLEATIQHLNANRAHIAFARYRDYVRVSADHAQQLSDLVKDYVAYDRSKTEYERLSKRLEVPASGAAEPAGPGQR